MEADLSTRGDWVSRGLGLSESLRSLLGLESITVDGLGSALEWESGSRLEIAARDWGQN